MKCTTKSNTERAQTSRAFTLIELLVVVSIIALRKRDLRPKVYWRGQTNRRS